MKKFLVYILVLSMLVLCSCRADVNMGTEQTSDISSIQKEEVTTSSNIEVSDEKTESQTITTSQESKINVTSKETNLQPQKTIINVDPKTAKMSFYDCYNCMPIIKVKKNYLSLTSINERYTKSDMSNKTVNVLGVKYSDIPYYRSEKNSHTGVDYDIFENDLVTVHVLPDSSVCFFNTKSPIKAFPNETQHSEELAKKYLKKLSPNFKYNEVIQWSHDNTYSYIFYKSVSGIRTNEFVRIDLSTDGALTLYRLEDVGSYDNIEIKNLNVDDFLKRTSKYVTETYGDLLIEQKLYEDNEPRLEILVNDKLRLTIHIAVTAKYNVESEKQDTTIESFVFELN